MSMVSLINPLLPVITIDGPGGTGKGTVGQWLAGMLRWNFLDSGALYRLLALSALETGIDLGNEQALAERAHTLQVEWEVASLGSMPKVTLEGQDCTVLIRSEACSQAASQIAVFPAVRAALLDKQWAFLRPPGLVTDGRDMGTKVFPHAQLKIFLQASDEERAKRRYTQLKEKGIHVNLGTVLEELIERDRRDSERQIAPLMPAKDAFIIDTTGVSVSDVFTQVWSLVILKFEKVNA